MFGRTSLLAICCLLVLVQTVRAEGEWETTAESDKALEIGLQWLATNQGPEGNWTSNDLGLVGMGAVVVDARIIVVASHSGRSATISVTLTPPPDLHVTAMTVPLESLSAGTVTLTATSFTLSESRPERSQAACTRILTASSRS